MGIGLPGQATLVEGSTFCISGRAGDIRPGVEQGLFFQDTRFLSQFELGVDHAPLQPLLAQSSAPYTAIFMARVPPAAGAADSTVLVTRRRYVGNGMREDITIHNLGKESADVVLTLWIAADFADLFAVKEGRAQAPQNLEYSTSDGRFVVTTRYGDETRGVTVAATGDASMTSDNIEWKTTVLGRSEWTTSIQVVPSVDGVDAPLQYAPDQPIEDSQPATQLAAWRRQVPAISTPDERVVRMITIGAEDLGALRIFDPEQPSRAVVAAGAPWFMALFGRDSLLTSWMLLPIDASLALSTLQTLAELQGETEDPLTDEQPGRILHEVRFALPGARKLGGRHIYYGSVDATPLFVMLLGELRRWGLATSEVTALLPHADRALNWIETYGDRDGDGFVEYERASEHGLANQGWKDSFDGINFASGEIAEPPIALAEVQGYVYAAFLARAHFARELGDEQAARRWSGKAGALKRRFNDAFWLPDRGYYAIGLDADKRPIDSLTSNMGHCLWTGIVDQDKAASVAARLVSPEMFTGFGVRTLATSMGAYNPMSYHNGSVWPHDNSIVAAGLMRYGFVAEAQQIALAIFDAAEHFDARLPELFCGFTREEFPSPVPYPTSCSPQAWAAASPLFLLRTLLRFDPWIPFGQVWCRPAVPDRLLPLQVDGLHLAGADVSINVTRDGCTIGGLPDDIELIREPRRPMTAGLS
jgi:glycogen debranching enzyme